VGNLLIKCLQIKRHNGYERILHMDKEIVEIARLYAQKVRSFMPVNKRIEPVLLCRESDRGGFFESVLKHGKVVYRSES
jgi:hypothetical protein